MTAAKLSEREAAAQLKRAAKLVALMHEARVWQADLAAELGCSQGMLSNYLNAKNRWPGAFEEQVRLIVAKRRLAVAK